MTALGKRMEQESGAMQERVRQMMRRKPEDAQASADQEAENRQYKYDLRRVRVAAKKEGHSVYQGRDPMGCYGLRVVDENNVIIGGEHYDLDLVTVAGWCGIAL